MLSFISVAGCMLCFTHINYFFFFFLLIFPFPLPHLKGRKRKSNDPVIKSPGFSNPAGGKYTKVRLFLIQFRGLCVIKDSCGNEWKVKGRSIVIAESFAWACTTVYIGVTQVVNSFFLVVSYSIYHDILYFVLL